MVSYKPEAGQRKIPVATSRMAGGKFPMATMWLGPPTLMKHDLVDEFWLKIYPLTLGSGKRLFVDGTIPAAFKVTESTVSPNGIIIVNYERAGAIRTGSY